MELARIAELARLGLSSEEIVRLEVDVRRILDFVAQLEAADPGPAALPTPSSASLADLRDDRPLPGLENAEALARAEEVQDGFFRVPRTVGG